ncbi:MAG TPA: class I SAM-dependent methyltransferase [Phycisphaerae bacterium]|nr:class I SAM-dependent methyltransferase [Phycisphaerae bacterium]
MSDSDTNIEKRERVQADWDEAADHWARWEPYIHNLLWPVSVRLAAGARLRAGMKVLDVGTGTGDMALFAAGVVENSGSVVGIDLSEDMLQTARDRARVLGFANVSFEQASGDVFAADSQSFDAIVGRFSAFFFPDVVAGLSHLRTLLKPGGRASFSLWTPPEVNPVFGIPRDALAPFTKGQQEADSFNPFRHSGPGLFATAMKEAGYAEVTDEEVGLYQFAPGCEAYWDILVKVSTSFRKQYDPLSEKDQHAVKQSVLKQISQYETNGIVRVPARARVVSGTST